jgi:1-acyl-sn-glycerol-3-phosphate acyltransferase
MWFMAKEELFRNKLIGGLLRSVGAFPVKRGEGDTESVRHTIDLLESGEAVLIFPEGTRGDGVTMGPLNKGVGLIAKRTGVPIVPVGVVGTHVALPRGAKKLKRHPITLVYGTPFTYAEVSVGLSDREARTRFAEVLSERIRAACAAAGYEVAQNRAE